MRSTLATLLSRVFKASSRCSREGSIGHSAYTGYFSTNAIYNRKSQRRDFELEELLDRDFITAEDLFLGDEHEWYARDPSPAEESGTLGLGKLLATAAKFIIRDEPEIFARAGDQESGALNIGSILDTAAKILFREEPELLSRALNERLQYAKRGIRERWVWTKLCDSRFSSW